MSTSGGESRDVAKAAKIGPAKGDATVLEKKASTPDEEGISNPKYDVGVITSGSDTDEALRGPNGEEYPSKEDLKTLRRVKGHISSIIYTIAFIELCERFAYYGTTAVCMSSPPQSLLETRYGLKHEQSSILFSSLSRPGPPRALLGRLVNPVPSIRASKLPPVSSPSTPSGLT